MGWFVVVRAQWVSGMSVGVSCNSGSRFHEYLQELLPSLEDDGGDAPSSSQWGMVTKALRDEFVPMELLRVLALSDRADLKTLVVGSRMVFDADPGGTGNGERDPKEVERRRALNERREYLRKRHEERQYNMMMYGQEVNPEVQREMDRGNSLSSKSNHISIAMNMIMSVLACFAIAYYVGLQSNIELATSMIYGLIAAILILMVEMLLYILRAMSMEKHYDSREKVEKKVKRRTAGDLDPSSTSTGTSASPMAKLITKTQMLDALSAGAQLREKKEK